MSQKAAGACPAAEELLRALSPPTAARYRVVPPRGTVFGERPEEELELLAKIGEGSFGTVWRAVHRPSQSLVAVKKVTAEGEDESMREGATMEQLTHENIVRFYALYR